MKTSLQNSEKNRQIKRIVVKSGLKDPVLKKRLIEECQDLYELAFLHNILLLENAYQAQNEKD